MSEAPQLSMQPREMTPYEYLIALVQPRREATSMIPRNITLPSSIINDISSPHLAGVSNTTPPVTSRTVPQISESWPTPGFDFSSLSSDSESSFSQDVDASSCVMLESSFENLPENPWCPLPSAGENGDAPYRRTRSMYGGFHTGTGVCAIGGGGYEAVQQGQALLNTYGSYHNLRFDPNIQSTQYATQGPYREPRLPQYQERISEDIDEPPVSSGRELLVCDICDAAPFSSQFTLSMHRGFHGPIHRYHGVPQPDIHNYFTGRYRPCCFSVEQQEEFQNFGSCSVIFTLPAVKLGRDEMAKSAEILKSIRVGKVYHLFLRYQQVEVTFFKNVEAKGFLGLVQSKKFLIGGKPVTRACWSDNPLYERNIVQFKSRVVELKGSVSEKDLEGKFSILSKGLLSTEHVWSTKRNCSIQRFTYRSALKSACAALGFLQKNTDFEVRYGADPCDPTTAESVNVAVQSSGLDPRELEETSTTSPSAEASTKTAATRLRKATKQREKRRAKRLTERTAEQKHRAEEDLVAVPSSPDDSALGVEQRSAARSIRKSQEMPSIKRHRELSAVHRSPSVTDDSSVPQKRQRGGKLGRLDRLLSSSSMEFCLSDAISDKSVNPLSKNQQRKEARRKAKEQERIVRERLVEME